MKQLLTKEDVIKAMQDLEAQRKKVTCTSLHAALGNRGSMSTLLKLKAEIQETPALVTDSPEALKHFPDVHLLSVLTLEPMVDLFSNIFPQDIRSGEIGLLPNGQIPGLELFLGEEPRSKDN